jgi:hypothetical protein
MERKQASRVWCTMMNNKGYESRLCYKLRLKRLYQVNIVNPTEIVSLTLPTYIASVSACLTSLLLFVLFGR